MNRSSETWLVALISLAALAGSGAWAAPSTAAVTLKVQNDDVAKVAVRLSHELRAPVRIEGERKAPVSVDVTDASFRTALDAVAAAADGQWQRVYVLSGRGMGGGAGAYLSGRLVTLSLEEVSVATAAATVAKAAGARLEIEDVTDRRISVVAESEPVEAVLDRLTKEAGLVWRAEYALTVSEPAPKTVTPTKSPSTQPRAKATATPKRGAPGNRQGAAAVPPGTELKAGPITRRSTPSTTSARLSMGPPADVALGQPSFYRYLFSLPRTKREPFIKDLAEELSRTGVAAVTVAPGSSDPDAYRGAALRAQSVFERRMRRAAILNVIQSMPAAHRKELQPIVEAVSQGMRTGTQPGGPSGGSP
jgi:hypothetical protein